MTIEKALDYLQGFIRLDGYARAVVTAQGPQIVVDSYDLSPKVKWRCTVNRELLQAVKTKFDVERKKHQAKYDALDVSLDPKLEDKERALELAKCKHDSDLELAELGAEEIEVPGLLRLPGEGIRIRARDPGIMGILALLRADFIDGEPDYGQDKPKKADAEVPGA